MEMQFDVNVIDETFMIDSCYFHDTKLSFYDWKAI